MARDAGFDNLSVDLIYGLPNQTLDDWQTTLVAALAPGLRPDHVSAYCLTVEDGTPLADEVVSGRVPEPEPDLAAEMYELTEEVLATAGLDHYEISNWAQRGRECRHNLIYWRDEDYVGFGAGAHSHRGRRRWWNVLSPAEYIATIQASETPLAREEEMDTPQAMGEMMMMGLRLEEGVSAKRFRDRFDQALGEMYSRELRELASQGLIEWDGQQVRLTARGRLLGNQVFLRFLP
jgi:oxygen-independent coproporphyrinogen-3 oxidase